MSDRLRTAVVILLWALCCEPLAAAGQAAAQSVEPFYKGRTVTMLVGTSPGGINDISARLTARHLSRFIPGNPNIIVQNNPGGGGLVTANRLFFNSDKDGSVSIPTRTARSSPSSSAPFRSSPSRAIRTPSSIRQSSPGLAACRLMPTTPT
jgi:tripartite-type tricarboxylate transporter receptor subunit TctC